MQYYAEFAQDGNIVGFYLDEIHGDNIPTNTIPITVEGWGLYIANPSHYKLDGEIVRGKTSEEIQGELDALPLPPPTNEERLASLEMAMLDILAI